MGDNRALSLNFLVDGPQMGDNRGLSAKGGGWVSVCVRHFGGLLWVEGVQLLPT